MLNELYIYKIPDLAIGVVKANSENEAIEKVSSAYSKHNTCFNDNEIIIIRTDNCWFSDSPDVFEVDDL